MKVLAVSVFMLGFSGAVQSMCYQVYDGTNELIYSSMASPVRLDGRSPSEAVQRRFPGGHMIIINASCDFIDRTTAEGRERTEYLQRLKGAQLIAQSGGGSSATPAGSAGASSTEMLETEQSQKAALVARCDEIKAGGRLSEQSAAAVRARCVSDIYASPEDRAARKAAYAARKAKEDAEYKYVGASGQRYKYDLSNPLDRMKYSTDIPAQVMDSTKPSVSIDKSQSQYGGGAK